MTRLTRTYRFAASHRMHSAELSEERNREVFGKCANPFGHGHNYVLDVCVAGEPDSRSGLTLARAALDRCVQRAVIERLDHAHLNADVPEFAEAVPTSENLLLATASWLRAAWDEHFGGTGVRLAGLRLEETPRNSFRLDFTKGDKIR